MGYDAYARHIFGIPVKRNQFFEAGGPPENAICANGHIYDMDDHPAFCPKCGGAVMVRMPE